MLGTDGLLTDDQGRWISGFVHFMGIASSICAELCTMMSRLETVWNLSFRKVILEVDYEIVAWTLSSLCMLGRGNWTLLRETRKILARDCVVMGQHSYREVTCVHTGWQIILFPPY